MRAQGLFVAILFTACSGAAVPDASAPDAHDASPTDASDPADAGVDATDAALDADVPHDAGSAPDAEARDAEATDARLVIDAGEGCPPPLGEGVPFRLRAVAANLTSGNAQSWDPGEGLRILKGLRPDVVLMQEMNYGDESPETFDAMVQDTFSEEFTWARGLGGQIPNGIISRWPILASGDWPDPEVGNRAFTWAHIDLPGARDLWAVSIHLLTSRASDRNAEGRALLAALEANVPDGDFILVGGDFNTDSHNEGVYDILDARLVSDPPYPADADGNPNTNRGRTSPYDAVLPSPCLDASQVAVEIGAQQFPAGLVFDSRVYTPLDDVSPVLRSDSEASHMQHMAVVRDFVIQP
ncbi:endonuclease/exonuclease/phosphatase family protein [Myxococcota bacterium]|nr:endonuclease/exonuclease/phosphatase family protein [Myxococcota bacterium]